MNILVSTFLFQLAAKGHWEEDKEEQVLHNIKKDGLGDLLKVNMKGMRE